MKGVRSKFVSGPWKRKAGGQGGQSLCARCGWWWEGLPTRTLRVPQGLQQRTAPAPAHPPGDRPGQQGDLVLSDLFDSV